ncbi:hypothetical protein H9Q72_009494 [Fusarium xylarioides]|uniref:FAD-binding PCMH-type domain-containing protein n=1 Tax=Fusarium xylarioides TaxID=221167 RepID=A0A9P7HML6_9HYPO|nr:hypothetical protein H9Q72_009494 [Fusarium xylarioides]
MLAIFLAILTGLFFVNLYKWLLPKPLPGIPYNEAAIKNLFGDAPDMARVIKETGEFNGWMTKQVEKLKSPICQVFVRPFSKPWILLADFREAEDILMRRSEFDKPTFLSQGMLCLGDFSARFKTNQQFKTRRHLKHDLMTPTFLNTFVGPFVQEEGLALVRLLEIKSNLAKGRPFRLNTDYENVALDIVTRYEFGDSVSISALKPPLEHLKQLDPSSIPEGHIDEPVSFPEVELDPFFVAVGQAPHVLEKTTNSWTPTLSHWWWKHQGWYKKIFSQKTKLMQTQIRNAVENYHKGQVHSALEHVVMREAALAKKQDREPQFDADWLIDEAFGDLVASHHTNSGAMCWLSKYLSGYPVCQSKLRSSLYDEIPEAVSQHRSPTFDEMRCAKLPYLEAVVAEMQRLTPFSMVREATSDTEILGHRIPKGCQVFMVNGGPGFLSPSFPVDEALRSPTSRQAKSRGSWDESKDLKLFDPERWLVVGKDGSIGFDAIAGPQLGFGAGVRQCWGRRMAQLQVKVILALVVWNFELLEIPECLGGYAAYDGISRQPQQTFVQYADANNIDFFVVNSAHALTTTVQPFTGIQINLRSLNGVKVQPDEQTVLLGAGALNHEVINALWNQGFVTTSGACSCVGMAGPALGGGHGLLQGFHGLISDNIVNMNVILANGSAVTVNGTSHSDLWWAMRGAGHNFGIVTSFEMKIYPAERRKWYYKSYVFAQEKLEPLFNELIRLQDTGAGSDAELAGHFGVYTMDLDVSKTESIIAWTFVFAGSRSAARHVLSPFDDLGALSTHEESLYYPQLFDALGSGMISDMCQPGRAHIVSTAGLLQFNVTAQRKIYNLFNQKVAQRPELNQTRVLHEGYSVTKVQSVPYNASSYVYREENLLMYFDATPDVHSDLLQFTKQWAKETRDLWNGGQPERLPTTYVNYAFGGESAESMYGYEPWRMERLRALKGHYDPKQRFRFYNHIKPRDGVHDNGKPEL